MKSEKTVKSNTVISHALQRREFLKLSLAAMTLVSMPIRLLRPEETAYAALTVDETTPIGTKWVRLGGESVVGAPISEVIATPDGLAQYQMFANGVIIYSNDWGAMYVSQAIFDKWLSLNQQVNPAGQNLLGYVGFPKQDYENFGTWQRAHFERGMIIVDATAAQAFVVYGFIYEHYWQAQGSIGLPVIEETDAPAGGRYQAFQGGDIYWRADLGAFTIYGAIRQRWLDLGGAGGVLGYPRSDEEPVKNQQGEIGRTNRFEHGVIYFSVASGAWELMQLREDYEGDYGGPTGRLGFPTSGEGRTENHHDIYNDFQKGILIKVEAERQIPHDDFPPGTYTIPPAIYCFEKVDLRIERLQGTDTDSILELGGSIDLYVWITIVTNDVVIQERRPAHEEYKGGVTFTGDEGQFDLLPEGLAVFHGYVVDVTMDAWDDDNDFVFDNDDDHLGTVHRIYNIDNMWGWLEPARHIARDDGIFEVAYKLRKLNHFEPDLMMFRQEMWWAFRNFKTPRLSYDQFAATFTDVDTDEAWWRHPFNALYYELFYKSIAESGNCFGMSLESVFAQVGRSLYAEPLNQYWPGLQPQGPEGQDGPLLDPNNHTHRSTMYELNIKQGYQLGAPSVDLFFDKFLSTEDHDPVQCFWESRAAHDRGDYPIIHLNNKYLDASGHTVRPYRWEEVPYQGTNQTRLRIYIADPNKPASRYPYNNDPLNFIEIDPQTNSFIFWHYADDLWTGGDGFSGGRMYSIPFHKLSNPPRTPFWDLLLSLLDGSWLFLDPTGITRQISDEAHRTLYEEGLQGPPTSWEDIRNDPASRIPNMTRVPFSGIDQTGVTPLEMHYARGSGATYHHEILARPGTVPGTPYEWVLQTLALSARLLIPSSADVADVITANMVNSPGKAVTVSLPANSAAKSITWVMAGPIKHRWLELTNLEIAPGQSITIRLTNGGFEAVIENSGPATSADLRVQAGPGANPVTVGRISIPSGLNSPFRFDVPLTTLTYEGGTPGENGWLVSHPTITLTAQDYSGTGIEYIEYSINGVDWIHYTEPFLLDAEGVIDFRYRARDNAGNREGAHVTRFMIDTRPPEVIARTNQESYTRLEPIIVYFEANDPEPGSGLASVIGQVGNLEVTNGQSLDFFWNALGTYTLTVTAQDQAGWRTTESVDFRLIATLTSLRETILYLRQIGEIDNDGIVQSLLSKIDNAISAQEQARFNVAVNQLRAFLNHAEAQQGKHITARAAELLINDGEYVQLHIQDR